MFFQFSPVRAEKKPKPVQKENESEKLEVLSLAPFTSNPKLFFEDVKVGVTESRKLLINNPTNQDVNLFISSHIPEDLNVTLNWVNTTIEKNTNSILELKWCPLREEASRHVITIEDGKRIRRDVPIAFKSILPKKSKTGTKSKNKPHVTSRKEKSPLKRKSPIKKVSPTKKYYSTRPSNISPKIFSPSQKKYSPTFPVKPNLRKTSPSSKIQQYLDGYIESPKKLGKYSTKGKENYPLSLPHSSMDNVFLSPGNATFHLDYLQPSTPRRETYIIGKNDKSPSDTAFSDSLEASPDISPLIKKERLSPNIRESPQTLGKKLPLGISNRDNVSLSVYEFMHEKFSEVPPNHNFEYKLMQLESFAFTPVSTPVKQIDCFSPSISSTSEKAISRENTPDITTAIKLFSDKNRTFEIQNSPNISTETYIKSNLSTETYVKDNVSGATYTKENSIGDVANLSVSPTLPRISVSPGVAKTTSNINPSFLNRAHNLASDNARNIIEANLWTGIVNQPLSSIKEESYIQQSICENRGDDASHRLFLKRKSNVNISCTPPKRPSVIGAPKDWSRKGGTAFRIAKKRSGLNLKQFIDDVSITDGDKITAVLTKKDTNTIIIQNPFLLAATNLADPFMTPDLYVNEEWLDQQQRDFKKWLNALLTPPEELSSNEQVVDVAKVWQECKKKEVEAAPTKEIVSCKYHTNSKLNSLRKSAQNLFRSSEMSEILSKVVLAVETGRLTIRDDKDIHLNLTLKSEVMSMLLSYNPLWLRIGLETIYNEIIPLKSNSDTIGLSTFIANRFLKDPHLIKKHKSMHNSKYNIDFKKFFLKKFLVLVYFLDQAKVKKLIPHDPCLFRKTAPVKESREMLIRLAREILAAIGDITKFLKHIGYVVTHVQTYIHEFDYAVNNLGIDLRDGVRLTRLMEIILMQDDLTSNLRVPAISRLQKVHNMKIVFDSLENAGYKILYDISPKDIVDGHKEKTLSFLWQIIYKFQAPLMVKNATTIQTWFRSLPVVLKRRRLAKIRMERENAAIKIQTWYKRQKLAKKLFEFTSMVKKYVELTRSRRAAVKIQSCYRMYRCRKIYNLQYKTIINIQRLSRGWLVRNVYRERIKKAIIIQSTVRMYLARKNYLRLKNATNVIQTRYRAKKLMESNRAEYLRLRTSVIFVQRRFRAKQLAARDKISYQELRAATIFTQQKYRANKLCRIERQRYLEIKSAVIRIQTWYKSTMVMRTYREQYLTLKKTVIFTEQRYIAIRAMKVERSNYQTLRKACITIQQQYRAVREMRFKRGEYLELRAASIVVQRRYRAKKLMEREKQYFESLKSHTLVIQRKFRANRAMKIARANYVEMRQAAVKIQVWFRATREMRRCRTYYVSLKCAVHIFEDRYEARRLMNIQCSRYQQMKSAAVIIQRRYRALVAMREKRAEYCRLRTAVVFVQRKFRANKSAKILRQQYLELKQASIVIQSSFRAHKKMKETREDFLELRKAAVVVQRRFRANIAMREAKVYYQNVLKSTLFVQRHLRANKAMVTERDNYRKLRQAAIYIQQRWRANKLGANAKQSYEKIKKSALTIQRWWRANKLARQDKEKYEALKKAAITVQNKWRAKKLAEEVRNNYLRLKNAAIIIQRRWRAEALCQEQKTRYELLKKATIFIQKKWRAKKLAREVRNNYLRLKSAGVVIQQRWRARALCQEQKTSYELLKKTTIFIQRKWRAKKLAIEARNNYVCLRSATIVVQQRWRAKIQCRQQMNRYELLRKTTIFIQTKWRAKKLAGEVRNNYLSLKSAAVVIQQRWRAKVQCQEQKSRYELLKKTTIFIQTKWRANRLARQERLKYELIRKSTIIIQRQWRTKKIAEELRNNYVRLRNATIVVQQRWRAKKLCQQQKARYQQLRKATIFIQRTWRLKQLAKRTRDNYTRLKIATINIQRRWRAQKLMVTAVQEYTSLKSATSVVQRQFRAQMLMKKERCRYLKIQTSVILIQRFYRGYVKMKQERREFEMKRKATLLLQKYFRGFLIRRKYANYFTPEAREQRRVDKMKQGAAVKIQAAWRGYRSRSLEEPDLIKIRTRAKKAYVSAEVHNTLGSRCKVALQTLVNDKSTLFVINKALEDLDFITRHSSDMCAQVAQFLPEQIYLMIKHTNRSLPEMNACIFSVHILINFYKYRPTRHFSFIPKYIDNIITVMLHWCDKEAQVFPSMCTLLWFFAHNPDWKEFIKSLPNVEQKLSKIQAQVMRKESMVKRTGVKGQSLFVAYKNLPYPSSDPDWGLEYKHKPFIFTNSVQAIHSLFSILNL